LYVLLGAHIRKIHGTRTPKNPLKFLAENRNGTKRIDSQFNA